MTKEITLDDLKRYRALVETGSVLDKNTVLSIISHAGEAAETILRKQNAIDTLDRIITQQCQAALDATGLHHLIDEDGDGDWSAVWEGLQELQANSKPEPNFEVVSSVEELEALPVGTILRDYVGLALHKRQTSNWWVTNGERELTSGDLAEEIADTACTYRVLYRPEVDK